MKTKSNEIIYAFLDYLNASLAQVERIIFGLNDHDEVVFDWMQSSWEMLVENALFYGTKNSLVIYGDGADVCKGSSRVTFPNMRATHKVKCVCDLLKQDLISKEKVDVSNYEFEQFVKWDGGWFSNKQELDCVLLSKGSQQYVVSLDGVRFEIATR